MSRHIQFYILDVFTETPFAGNPAGVFFDPKGTLSDEEMRQLAGEVSLESAFVLPGDDHSEMRLRYFTGRQEIPFCGHATVAAMTALASSGQIPTDGVRQVATPIGLQFIEMRTRNGSSIQVTMLLSHAEFGNPMNSVSIGKIAEAIGCPRNAVQPDGLPVQRVNVGSPFLYIPVTLGTVIDGLRPVSEVIARISQETDTLGIFAFAIDSAARPFTTWARCFAPITGLTEDPVTGSASAGLGFYLAKHKVLPKDHEFRFMAKQGYAIGRGGQVAVMVRRNADGETEGVFITGSALTVADGTMTLPDT